MTLQEMVEKIPTLTIEERRQLMHTLVDSLTDAVEPKKRRITELRGLGAEMWKGVDVQDYINELRNEWDNRP